MKKYMGNKDKILPQIYKNVVEFVDEDINSLIDAFSGTTNVGRYFKENGFDVISNDINDLSYVLGKCYIENSGLPEFKKLFDFCKFNEQLEKLKNTDVFKSALKKIFSDNKNVLTKEFIKKINNSNYHIVLVYLSYFASENDYDDPIFEPYNFITKNYTEFGGNARYINLVYKKTLENIKRRLRTDGINEWRLIDKFYKYPYDIKYLIELEKFMISTNNRDLQILQKLINKPNLAGSRKFFSKDHAYRIDVILNTLEYWLMKKALKQNEFYVLLTALIESVTIFSNTSATYQAFYKDYRANTKQEFRLYIPELSFNRTNVKILQEDATKTIVNEVADVLYLDPPYNWRQYDSNYHLLNTIAKYHNIEDINAFEKGIVGASGENRIEKLVYTSFNIKGFVEILISLIKKSKAKYIVLSYSDSESNHTKKEIEGTINTISEFFADKSIFSKYELVKIESINFESRKGNKKEKVNELLFLGKKL